MNPDEIYIKRALRHSFVVHLPCGACAHIFPKGSGMLVVPCKRDGVEASVKRAVRELKEALKLLEIDPSQARSTKAHVTVMFKLNQEIDVEETLDIAREKGVYIIE